MNKGHDGRPVTQVAGGQVSGENANPRQNHKRKASMNKGHESGRLVWERHSCTA